MFSPYCLQRGLVCSTHPGRVRKWRYTTNAGAGSEFPPPRSSCLKWLHLTSVVLDLAAQLLHTGAPRALCGLKNIPCHLIKIVESEWIFILGCGVPLHYSFYGHTWCIFPWLLYSRWRLNIEYLSGWEAQQWYRRKQKFRPSRSPRWIGYRLQ